MSGLIACASPDYEGALSGAADWGFDGGAGCQNLAAVLRINADENLTVFRDGEVVSSGVIIGRDVITDEADETMAEAQVRLSLRYILNSGDGAEPFTIFRDTFFLGDGPDGPLLRLHQREYRANPERAWVAWRRDFTAIGVEDDPRWHGVDFKLCH
ncbi:MAG: hypothetical protein AAFX09_08475 [Pseudomonadota bacterium]